MKCTEVYTICKISSEKIYKIESVDYNFVAVFVMKKWHSTPCDKWLTWLYKMYNDRKIHIQSTNKHAVYICLIWKKFI